MTTMIDKPASAPRLVQYERDCVLCHVATAQRTYLTCALCSEQVVTMLGEIGDLYAEQVEDPFSVLPVVTGESSTTVSYHSSSPTSLRRIDLIDRRPDLDGRARGVHEMLIRWADDVRRHNHLPARPRPRCRTASAMARGTVHTELGTLREYWWWIRAQQPVGRLVHELRTTRDELLDLARERAGLVRIGRCTGPMDERNEDGCGRLLLVRIGEKSVTCSDCGTHWPSIRWPELRETLR